MAMPPLRDIYMVVDVTPQNQQSRTQARGDEDYRCERILSEGRIGWIAFIEQAMKPDAGAHR